MRNDTSTSALSPAEWAWRGHSLPGRPHQDFQGQQPHHKQLIGWPMQTNLGGSLSDMGIVAAYCYAARYVYSDVVLQNDNFLRLTASADTYQTPLSDSVLTRPACRPIRFNDISGNITHRARVTIPHQELTILSIGVVQFDSPRDYPGEIALDSYSHDSSLEQCLTLTPVVYPDALTLRARDKVGISTGLMESVERVASWVYGNIQYVKSSTSVSTTAEEVLDTGVGVCQDVAHLAVGLLKALGIPSRYVCGLLTTEVGEPHAWLEFWHPHQGWTPSDPTRGHAVARYGDFLKFAIGRDCTEAAPVEGSFVSRGSGSLDTAAA